MRVRILLVEDNEVNADMLTRRLIRRGFVVTLATDGVQAVRTAQRETPDVILMDMSLPEIDGWEATRRLKSDPATAHIPVIALTAHAMVSDREKCFAVGCEEFETKPIELGRLIDKIQAIVGTVVLS